MIFFFFRFAFNPHPRPHFTELRWFLRKEKMEEEKPNSAARFKSPCLRREERGLCDIFDNVLHRGNLFHLTFRVKLLSESPYCLHELKLTSRGRDTSCDPKGKKKTSFFGQNDEVKSAAGNFFLRRRVSDMRYGSEDQEYALNMERESSTRFLLVSRLETSMPERDFPVVHSTVDMNVVFVLFVSSRFFFFFLSTSNWQIGLEDHISRCAVGCCLCLS